jgi:formamidopyrimidine-DNA glycosylase
LGQTILAVTVYDGRLRWPVPGDLPQLLEGRAVRSLDRRARYLLLRFDTGTLIIHLGMTGTLRCYSSAPPLARHEHLEFRLSSGDRLRYRDPRRFGAVLWTSDPPECHPLLAELGPEPLSPDFDAKGLYVAIHYRRVALKLALMDNRVVSGVGNIYASEALFRAGLRPTRPCARVSRAACARLLAAVREILDEAIAAGGSTLRDYVDAQGNRGYFQLEHRVYGRAGLPCRNCGTSIRELRLGGRSSCYCPHCQK